MNVPKFDSTGTAQRTETSLGVVTVTRPFTKEALVTLQQGINPSAMMVEKQLSKASTANFSAPSPMVVLSGIVLSQATGNFSNWVSGMGEKITLKSAHGKWFQPNPMVACKSIGTMRHPAAGKSSRLKPGQVQPGDAHDFVHLKSVHGFYLSATDGTVQWNRDHAPPGGWEDIQFVPEGIKTKNMHATGSKSLLKF